MNDKIGIPGEYIFMFFMGIVYGVYRLFKWFAGGDVDYIVEYHVDKESKKGSQFGFGIDTQMRRRRLDLTRRDNSFRTSVGNKITRQRRGMINRRRSKRKRRSRR
jgi:hypothetical protein